MINLNKVNEILKLIFEDPFFTWIDLIVFFYFTRKNKLTQVETATLGLLLCVLIQFYFYSL